MPIKADDIYVYGDPLDRDINNMKAYSKFELKADMVSFYKKAYENLMAELEDKNVKWFDIDEVKVVTTPTYTEAL